MKTFDLIIEWINYGSKVLKTVSAAMGAVRDNWPTMPNRNTVEDVKKEVTTASDSKQVKEEVTV